MKQPTQPEGDPIIDLNTLVDLLRKRAVQQADHLAYRFIQESDADVATVTYAELDDWKPSERFTLIDPDHIDYQATIRDPRTFSGPWTIRMPLYRMIEPNAELLEFKCVPFVEELLYKDLELELEDSN